MPFNQLILPLLGGYIFLVYANCAIYWSSRQSKEQLLFASAFLGVLLATVSRVIVVLLSKFSLGAYLFGFIHSLLDYPGIGTAFLALGISVILTWLTNKAWPEREAGFWLYGKGMLNQFESLLYLSFSGVMPIENRKFRSLHGEIFTRLIWLIPYVGDLLVLISTQN
ncbi:hypothetical protein [Dokdonella sp.]|uniref:hypothetical protein n=1 Tax=Dokdonella sp. TaxID=2291710 RepID=UPI0035282493